VHDRVTHQLNRDVLDRATIGFGHRVEASATQGNLLRLTARDARRQIRERALETGAASLGIRLAGLLTGPVPLALRLLGGKSRRWRRAAAVSSLAGSLMSRFAWIAAGRESAENSRASQ